MSSTWTTTYNTQFVVCCNTYTNIQHTQYTKTSTVDFRNFIVLFWAETLAHWNPTSCQQKHPQLICSDLRLSNWRFEDWNYGNRPYYCCSWRPSNNNLWLICLTLSLDSRCEAPIYIYVCIHVHISLSLYIYIYVLIMYVCMYVCIYIYIYIFMYTCIYIYIYIYMYIYIYIYMYMCICIYACYTYTMPMCLRLFNM